MEGFIAILGFFACIIALILKKPISTYLERNKVQDSPELSTLSERVLQLESTLLKLTNQVIDLKESTEQAQAMLIESAERLSEAQQLLLESSQENSIEISSPTESSLKLIEAGIPEHLFGKVVNDHTVRFERLLPGPIEEVWNYFSSPEHLSSWLASTNIEPRLGGRIELNFDRSQMSEGKLNGGRIIGLINGFEPLRKIAFSWMDITDDLDSAVSVELADHGDQTSVVLTHSRLPKDRMHEFLASWHTHLDILAALLSNAVPPLFGKRFNQVLHKYAAIVASTIVISGASGMASMPAEAASGLDEGSYQTIKAERSDLMKQYDLLWRDVDEHQRRVDSLKKESSIESQRQVDQLDRQLEDEYRNLHQLEHEIKALDKVLK